MVQCDGRCGIGGEAVIASANAATTVADQQNAVAVFTRPSIRWWNSGRVHREQHERNSAVVCEHYSARIDSDYVSNPGSCGCDQCHSVLCAKRS